jgi:hypothetical protein
VRHKGVAAPFTGPYSPAETGATAEFCTGQLKRAAEVLKKGHTAVAPKVMVCTVYLKADH